MPHGDPPSEPAAASARLEPCSLAQFLLYFLRLGAAGFGGPIALAGYMQRDLVERKRWISKEDYLDGLALSQLAPGPLAAQLAMYLGWVRAGVLGATLVSFAFILPSFLMVIALSMLYVKFGRLPGMEGLFYGIGAAVIAVIARSAAKLARLSLGKDWLLWTLFVINAGVTAWLESEIVWVFIKAFVDGVTAAATGAIGGAAFVLAKRAIVDWPTAVIGLVTLALLFAVKKIPEPVVILAAGGAGLAIKGL